MEECRNYLELLTAFLALKTFAPTMQSQAILLRMDSVMAITFVNRMGGGNPLHTALQSSSADVEVVLREKHLHSCRTPTRQREYESRLVLSACTRLQQLETPFLSVSPSTGESGSILHRPLQFLNQCSSTYLLRPDPSAVAIDALSISWKLHYPYLFTPFAILNRCLAGRRL